MYWWSHFVCFPVTRTGSCCGWRCNRSNPFIDPYWNSSVPALEEDMPPTFLWGTPQFSLTNTSRCQSGGSDFKPAIFGNSTKKHKVNRRLLLLMGYCLSSYILLYLPKAQMWDNVWQEPKMMRGGGEINHVGKVKCCGIHAFRVSDCYYNLSSVILYFRCI